MVSVVLLHKQNPALHPNLPPSPQGDTLKKVTYHRRRGQVQTERTVRLVLALGELLAHQGNALGRKPHSGDGDTSCVTCTRDARGKAVNGA